LRKAGLESSSSCLIESRRRAFFARRRIRFLSFGISHTASFGAPTSDPFLESEPMSVDLGSDGHDRSVVLFPVKPEDWDACNPGIPIPDAPEESGDLSFEFYRINLKDPQNYGSSPLTMIVSSKQCIGEMSSRYTETASTWYS
jgi:hypothetical protein